MMKQIFISYNSADRDWAHWIGWNIREFGFQPRVHEWEVAAGENVPAWMESALGSADGMIAVVSPFFLTAKYSQAEVHAGIWRDFQSRKGFVKPIVVKRVEDWPIFLGNLKRLSLVGLSENEAEKALDEFLQDPTHPDEKPRFPGLASRPISISKIAPLFEGYAAAKSSPEQYLQDNGVFLAGEALELEKARSDYSQSLLEDYLKIRDSSGKRNVEAEEALARRLNQEGLKQLDLGDPTEALTFFEASEDLFARVFGEAANSVAISKSNQADALLLRSFPDDLTDALRLSREAVAAQEAKFGPNPPEADISRTKVARVLLRLGGAANLDEALRLLDEAEKVARSSGTLRDISGVRARVYKRLGTRQGLEIALQIEEALLGEVEDREERAVAANNLAHTLWALDQRELAAAKFELAIGLKEELYGPGHPDVADTIQSFESLKAGEKSGFAPSG